MIQGHTVFRPSFTSRMLSEGVASFVSAREILWPLTRARRYRYTQVTNPLAVYLYNSGTTSCPFPFGPMSSAF